jgi:outer membrane protein TolC
VELPRAQAEVAARQLEFEVAQSNVAERENRLKEALSGGSDPAVEAAAIIPVDHMEVPAQDDLQPLPQMIAAAMQRRPDAAVAKIREETLAIGALGTINPLLPSLSVNLQAYNRGSAGQYQPSSGAKANPFFIGGYGTALGQIARRDFPSESASVSFFIPLENRAAQADYGIDQLQLRQSAVSGKRDANSIAVAISNEVIALRQARVRYSAASETRTLQEELLKAEQQKFSFGKSQSRDVILAQRALAVSRISEVDALAAYVRARVSLDQVLGLTLEVNHVSVDDALARR